MVCTSVRMILMTVLVTKACSSTRLMRLRTPCLSRTRWQLVCGKKFSDVRKNGDPWWFRAHGKTQVTIEHVEGTDESLNPRKIRTFCHARHSSSPRAGKSNYQRNEFSKQLKFRKCSTSTATKWTQEKTGEREGEERDERVKEERRRKERKLRKKGTKRSRRT